mgnify:CR=1 FL=1
MVTGPDWRPAALPDVSLYSLRFVDGAPMPDRENENDEFRLPHLVKNAPIPNPIGPPVAEKTRETLPEFRVLGQTSYRFSNPFLDRTIKLPDFLSSFLRIKDPVSHLKISSCSTRR